MTQKGKTLIPIKIKTKIELKKICQYEGRTYDSVINEFIEMYYDTMFKTIKYTDKK